MSRKTQIITTDEILDLYKAHEGRINEFIRMSTKLNPDDNGSLWNNIEFYRNGAWTTGKYDLKFKDERMAYGITPLTSEDAVALSKLYKYKTPMKPRESPKYMAPTVQFHMYPEKISIDPKTGLLEEGKEMPTTKSKLVQVFDILAKLFEEVYTDRVQRKQLVTSVKERDANPGSQKIASTKICSVLQYEYGEEHPTLAGKPLLNPILRITMPFEKDGSAKNDMYYKNDITAAQKAANETQELKKKHLNIVPYTVTITNPDGTTTKEPLCDRNVHMIPMFSIAVVGTIPLSGCCSNFGISMPRKFKKVVFTESESHKDSIEDLFTDDEEDDEETPAATTSDTTANTKAVTPDADDEPNLDGLEDE